MEALAKLPPEALTECAPAIVKRLEHYDEDVRSAAVQALASCRFRSHAA